MEPEQRPPMPPGWLPPGAMSATPAGVVAPPAPGAPPPPAPARGPAGPPPSTLRRLLGPLFVAGALALKFGKVALLALPKLKILTTSGSMLVSIAAYSLIWGWRFAVGFVVLLFIHEMGHVIQLRREGVQASAPMFIPFLGAVVSAKGLGRDAAAEARVGLAGPILGTAAAAACIPLAEATGNDLFRALAFIGFFLNLFNLLPVTPLDGGRAMAALSPWMWFVGLFLFAVLAFTFPNPIILLILLVGAWDTYRRWKAYRAGGPEARAYYKVPARQRAWTLAVYLGLVALLVVGMDATYLDRDLDDV